MNPARTLGMVSPYPSHQSHVFFSPQHNIVCTEASVHVLSDVARKTGVQRQRRLDSMVAKGRDREHAHGCLHLWRHRTIYDY